MKECRCGLCCLCNNTFTGNTPETWVRLFKAIQLELRHFDTLLATKRAVDGSTARERASQ